MFRLDRAILTWKSFENEKSRCYKSALSTEQLLTLCCANPNLHLHERFQRLNGIQGVILTFLPPSSLPLNGFTTGNQLSVSSTKQKTGFIRIPPYSFLMECFLKSPNSDTRSGKKSDNMFTPVILWLTCTLFSHPDMQTYFTRLKGLHLSVYGQRLNILEILMSRMTQRIWLRVCAFKARGHNQCGCCTQNLMTQHSSHVVAFIS